jgi:PAS domain S-box-containing protein
VTKKSESTRIPVEARLSEPQLRDLMRSLPHLVWTCLAEGPCDYLSRQWVEYTGIPEEEQLEYGWLLQLHPDDREPVKAKWQATVGAGAAFDIEFRIRRHDGVYKWFRTRAIPLRDDSGTIVKWYGSNTDIDDYRSTVDSLRESEAVETAVISAALDAIILMDRDGAIVDFNPAAERLFGYRPDDVIGRSLSEIIIPPSLRARHESALRRHHGAATSNVIGKRVELPAMRSDGTEFPAEIAIVKTGSEDAPMFVGYIRDTTERRRAQEADALRVAKEATESANRELEAFSDTVAHDLRKPLRAINGFSQALLEDYSANLDETARDYLQRIARSAQHMGGLIDGLLDLARIAKEEIRHDVVDVAELARSIIPTLVGNETRAVEWLIDDDMKVGGDVHLIRTLLEALLRNAWTFTQKETTARIEIRRDASAPNAFLVRDNGVGFDPAAAGELFLPFRCLRQHPEMEGAGMGLATVARIAWRHGGRVRADGEPGTGATIYVSLSRSS